LRKEDFSTLIELHLVHRVPLRFVHDEQITLEHMTHDLSPNLEPHISQFFN